MTGNRIHSLRSPARAIPFYKTVITRQESWIETGNAISFRLLVITAHKTFEGAVYPVRRGLPLITGRGACGKSISDLIYPTGQYRQPVNRQRRPQ